MLLFQNCTLQIIGHVVEDHISGGLGADGQLLALAQILERDGVLRDLVLAEEDGVGDAELVGVLDLLLELLVLGVELGADALGPQLGGEGDSRLEILRHREDHHVRRRDAPRVVQHILLVQHVEQARQADGNADARQLLFGVILGEVVFGTKSLGRRLVAASLGAILYRIILSQALYLGMESTDMKLVSAVIVAAALALGVIGEKGVKIRLGMKKGVPQESAQICRKVRKVVSAYELT